MVGAGIEVFAYTFQDGGFIAPGDECIDDPVTATVGQVLFIEAEALMPNCTEVELEFQLPEAGALLHSTARVVWAREESTRGDPSGMGLQFLAIDRDASQQIESFVFERARSDAAPANAHASSAA